MKNAMTNMEVKRENRKKIYRYMCKHGVVSNPELSYELKLSLPTVTQNTKELLEMGLIEELGELNSTGGRKAKALSVSRSYKLAVGLDITKNHISFALINMIGESFGYEKIYFPFQNTEEYYKTINTKLEEFIDRNGIEREKLIGIGIVFPGIIDLKKNKITDSHALGVQNVSLAEIEKYFQFPCIFFNDANAGAYAEGVRSNKEDKFFYFSLSNTVGGSFYTGAELMYGDEFRCGEIGHMTIIPDGEPCYCGKRGCFDAYCSAKRLSDLTEGKLECFFEKLKAGEQEIKAAWEQYVRYLAIATNNLHMILDCDIVLGGYVGSYLADYIDEIRKEVKERNTFGEDGTFIKTCEYKGVAAAMGSALYVIENFIRQL